MKKAPYLDVPRAQIRRIFSPLIIGALILYGVLGGGARVVSAQSLSLVWSDEFNGASIDLTKWTFDIGNGAQAGNPGWGNDELEYYTSNRANAYVTNGFLHIHAQLQVTNSSEGTFNYTSARMKTQGLFNKTYGRIEWRAKLPAGVGFWPALWSLGSNIVSVPWPGCGEIDVVENNGTPNFEQGSIHSGSDATEIFNFHGGDSVTNFHVYDLDWTNNSIIWSVDSVAYETQTVWSSSTGNPYPFPFNQPFFFLMNLAVGGDYLSDPSTNAINPSLPGEMVIDYIRVYDYSIVSIAVQANLSSGGTVSGGGTYYSGTNVTICASANSSCYGFANWTLNNNVVSTSACYTFAPTNSETLVANFTPLAYYTISTSSSPVGGGSTSGGATVPCGSNVTVCASAISCYNFTNWTLNGSVVSALPCFTFAAASNETLVANFVPTSSYTISTSSSPAGGGSTSGGATVPCGSNVTVCATANTCYSFANWTDQYSNVVSASACYTFTPNGNANLAANFIPITYTITTNSSPAGAGAISGGGSVVCSSNVTVCATPTPCYRFVDWTVNSSVVGTLDCYSFTATGNEVVVANFAAISYGGSIAGSLTTLHSFDYNDGAYPIGGLVLGSDSNFYGTTDYGGTGGNGSVFRISPTGSPTNLHSFSGPDGAYPYAGLVQASDGNFYGTTYQDGAGGYGTVFRITPGGSLTNLHSFSVSDGAYPLFAGLVQGSDSNLYGTTEEGGENGYGTVFRITLSGSLTTLHSFSFSDGGDPFGGLVLGSDSNFYGTTYFGGPGGSGTVFRISSTGGFASLYSFSGPDGAYPYAAPIQGSDGNFYGMTSSGGPFSYGTVFRISPGGSLTNLWSFSDCSDGANPYGALLQGADGSLYGTTSTGSGSSPDGTVFRLDPSGYFTNLWAFTGGVDGAIPYSSLVQGNDRALYGTTLVGGAHGEGTVFRIAAGLCASVLTPNSGDFSPSGGSGSVAVAATSTNCVWTAVSDSSFITITSGSSGTGSGTVSYTVAADTGTNNFGRSGTMTIAGLPFTVAQASLGCSFTLGSTNASFSAAGGPGNVTVGVGGSNCAWTATSNSGFITITSGSGGGGNGTVTYTVTANSNNVPRAGNMTLAGQTFTVTQGGFGCSAVLIVTSSPAGGGATSGGSTVGCGSNVTVCATPNACYSFVNWTVNGNAVSASACSTFAVPSNETLVANFAPIFSATINTSSSPTAGGSTSGDGTVGCGSNVTLCATANACYNFVNWIDQNSNIVSASPCYTFAPPSNETFVANFVATLSYYTITASSSPVGGGAVYGGGPVACGSTVMVCAVATPPCYIFVNWTDQNSNVVSTSACYSFTAVGNETLVANFALNSFGTPVSGSLTNLWGFTGGSDGGIPYAGLVQASDGNFYGTASGGGASGNGTVFRISSSGHLTNLWSFTGGSDGGIPYAGLVQASDGNFYGTASGGGASGNGTVFRISPTGHLTNLWSFTGGSDGGIPYAALVQGGDGNFYGTTTGSGSGPSGNGTVFRISPTGHLTNLWSFTGGSDGASPYAGLVQGGDGNFYGTTTGSGSGPSANGTVFRISPTGNLTNLWSFTGGSDGANPLLAALVQGSDGNFYGTASGGGVSGNGTVFRISPTGNLTNLWSFTGCGGGASPYAGLVQGSDGNFYGTTSGGASGNGTVFRISPTGNLTNLWSFTGGSDGVSPYAGLVQGSDGNFYGTASGGGASGNGTVFQLLVPLNPPANQISTIQLAGGNVILTIPSVAGETYQLQYSGSLTLSNWSNVGAASMTNCIGGLLSLTNFGGALQAQGFYRFYITP